MPKKDTDKKIDKNASKKAEVLGRNKPNRKLLIGFTTGVVLAAAAVAFYVTAKNQTGTAVNARGAKIVNGTAVVFPVSMFADGAARHFKYADGNRHIRYFILKSSDGILRVAFDACDVCWPANKGYYQDGDVMVCRNCGRRFASVLVNEVKGGCNPAALKRYVENDTLVIQIEDIRKGGQYFNFDGRVSS